MNSTDDAPSVGEQLLSNSQMILVISFYVVIFIVALFGNSIGLYVVFVKAVTRKLTNLLIKNLAIADLLVTLTIMPYSVLHLFFKPNQWFGGPAGTVTCKAIFYALPVSIAASIITMVGVPFLSATFAMDRRPSRGIASLEDILHHLVRPVLCPPPPRNIFPEHHHCSTLVVSQCARNQLQDGK
ncbi:unnamed protein product [Pocillopora meandrina]|uniref:G-protein coupled receptors family 1 profile domain-containing protein n=1 Tax=Pocillopora meandrina TaxID=46732 RepID=A0AAU9WRM4_9CNID|nr:unnamed protein product [Pocillopora meandrina]